MKEHLVLVEVEIIVPTSARTTKTVKSVSYVTVEAESEHEATRIVENGIAFDYKATIYK